MKELFVKELCRVCKSDTREIPNSERNGETYICALCASFIKAGMTEARLSEIASMARDLVAHDYVFLAPSQERG